MTITAKTTRVQYTGNGLVTTYAYGWKILDAADLTVVRTNTSGVDTTLALNSDYTVTGAGSSSGGNVVLSTTLTSGYRLTIYMDMDITQPTDLTNQQSPFLERIEAMADRQALISQQLQTQVGRCLQLSASSTLDPTTAVEDTLTARDQAVASAASAASNASAAQTAANSVGVLSTSGTLTTGNDTITLPWAYDTGTGNVAVFLSGVKQIRSTLTFVDSTHVKVGAAVAEDTAYEVTSVTLSGESLLTGLRDQCLAYQTGAQTAQTGAQTAQTGAQTAQAAAETAATNAAGSAASAIATHNADSGAHSTKFASLLMQKSYDSGNQTVTASGLLTLAHGLGGKPKLVRTFLKCLTAGLGFSVGDEVELPPNSIFGSTDGFGLWSDATNIYVRFASSGTFTIIRNVSDFSAAGTTAGSWALIVRAYA